MIPTVPPPSVDPADHIGLYSKKYRTSYCAECSWLEGEEVVPWPCPVACKHFGMAPPKEKKPWPGRAANKYRTYR